MARRTEGRSGVVWSHKGNGGGGRLEVEKRIARRGKYEGVHWGHAANRRHLEESRAFTPAAAA